MNHDLGFINQKITEQTEEMKGLCEKIIDLAHTTEGLQTEVASSRADMVKAILELESLKEKVVRHEAELADAKAEAVRTYKASKQYERELYDHEVGAFEFGFRLCKDQVGVLLSDFDLNFLQPPDGEDEEEGSDNAPDDADQNEEVTDSRRTGNSTP